MVDWKKIGKRTLVGVGAAALVFGGWYLLKGRNVERVDVDEPPINGAQQGSDDTADFWSDDEAQEQTQRTGVAALRYDVGCIDSQGRPFGFYKNFRTATRFDYTPVNVIPGTAVTCGVVNPVDDAVIEYRLERRVSVGGSTAYHRYGGARFEDGRISFNLLELGVYRLQLAVGDSGEEKKAERRRDLVFNVVYPGAVASTQREGVPAQEVSGEPLKTLPVERIGGFGGR